MCTWRQPLKQQSPIGASPKLGGFAVKLAPLSGVFGRAFETEVALRRPFLLAAGRGRHGCRPLSLRRSRAVPLAYRPRGRVSWRPRLSCPREAARVLFSLRVLSGFCGRTVGGIADVAAPALDKIRIVTLEGFIEEMDFRRNGARFLLRVHSAEGLALEQTPFRVRLTMRRTPPFEAGTYVSLKARLLPPPARVFPAAMISRGTPGSRGSARSAMCWGASRSCLLPNRPGSRPRPRWRSIAAAMRWRAASTKSLAAIRGRSRRRWSPASATCCPTKPRKSSARPESFISLRFPASR
jgi:hypothetical protein